jgi:NAD(P)-dependent dehydrogenase (short-subunit alcohol dehydrogenase family)
VAAASTSGGGAAGATNRTALITGGSSGLGLSLAKKLGSAGYAVVILARDQDRIERALGELRALNISATGYGCDVSDERRLAEVSKHVAAEHGALDFLVLNAGVVTTRLLDDYAEPAEIRRDLEINLLGVIFCSHFFAPLLRQGARLLMVSSGFGLMGAAGYSVYCASKAGIVNFAESLRRELLCHDIRVHVACPGDMDTPQFENEMRTQPDWMKQDSPRSVLPVDVAAQRILEQCRGRGKFLILSSADVRLLAALTKILPRAVRDYLLDRLMPRPKSAGSGRAARRR